MESRDLPKFAFVDHRLPVSSCKGGGDVFDRAKSNQAGAFGYEKRDPVTGVDAGLEEGLGVGERGEQVDYGLDVISE